MKMSIRLICLILFTSISLFAETLKERAKCAEELLGEYKLDDAFIKYTSILNDLKINDKPSLEFAYWIYRERSFAAFLMDDLATMQSDVQKMKEILIQLCFFPEYGMEEYWYAIDLARKG